jgi:hypothetical protein
VTVRHIYPSGPGDSRALCGGRGSAAQDRYRYVWGEWYQRNAAPDTLRKLRRGVRYAVIERLGWDAWARLPVCRHCGLAMLRMAIADPEPALIARGSLP